MSTDPHRLLHEAQLAQVRLNTRREFLNNAGLCLGAMALGTLGLRGSDQSLRKANPLSPHAPPFAPKAKRVIYLHMCGAPSQLELFDNKPALAKLHGQPAPDSFIAGKKFAFIKGRPQVLGPLYPFTKHGQSGIEMTDRIPHLAQVADELCVVRSLWTEQFNHAPAQLMAHTGSQIAGRPSLGAWAAYGLGSENDNLPGYIVLLSGSSNPDAGKQLWTAGFLPSVYQGVLCRSAGEPILFSNSPKGTDTDIRRAALDALHQVNQQEYQSAGDPETLTRIAQYELAFRMQMAAPEAMDIAQESEATLAMYGATPGKESFANNCLLARRLAERGVRFIQLFDWGWDSHGDGAGSELGKSFTSKCLAMDRAASALIRDLRQRGLLEDTLVVWGGEFGRTPMWENRSGSTNRFYGRDHHPNAFSMFMAGGGFKSGFTYGETDEFGYEVVAGKTHVHDLQATLLHQLGFDHEKLTYRFQGRDFRLTDTSGKVVKEILA